MGASKEGYRGERVINTIATLIGLTAIATGLGGVFANLFYGEGYLAALGLGVSLSTLCLGMLLFIMGLRGRWS
jgi:hypothetical protein